MFRQDHIKDDRQKTEKKCGGEADHDISYFGRQKNSKADDCQYAEQTGNGDKTLELSDIHIWQIDNGIQHLHGSPGTFPAPETVGYQDINADAEAVSGPADQKGGKNLDHGKFSLTIFGTAEDIIGAGLVIGSKDRRGDDRTEEYDQKGEHDLIIHGIRTVSREKQIGFFYFSV